MGEKATVCGKVVGIHFVSSGKGQPTFVHFDEPYPDQIFTLVIWGSERPKFGRPETAGVAALIEGLGLRYADDSRRMEEGLMIFDALYARLSAKNE